jgi:hypothetical protein
MIGEIAKSISSIKSLKTISIKAEIREDKRPEENSIIDLANAIKSQTELKSLKFALDSSPFNLPEGSAIAQAIGNLKELTSLTLVCGEFTDIQAIQQLSLAIKGLGNLTKLKIWSRLFSDSSIKIFVDSLSALKNLKHLSIKSYDITAKSIHYLETIVMNNLPQLESVSIEGDDFEPDRMS